MLIQKYPEELFQGKNIKTTNPFRIKFLYHLDRKNAYLDFLNDDRKYSLQT